MIQYLRANSEWTSKASDMRLLTKIFSCWLCLLHPMLTWDYKYLGRWGVGTFFWCVSAADSSLSDCVWWFIGNHVWKTELPFFGSATFSPLLPHPHPHCLGWMIDGRLARGGSGRYLLPSFQFWIYLKWYPSFIYFCWPPFLEKVIYLFFLWLILYLILCQLFPSYLLIICSFLQISFLHLTKTFEVPHSTTKPNQTIKIL